MNKPRERPLQAATAGHIGTPTPRPDLRRLLEGQGTYLDDIALPRLAHVAFVRSPYAHAAIEGVRFDQAAAAPGVLAVATGADIAKLCRPFLGVLSHLTGMRSVPQPAMAIDRALWHGEPMVAVVAETRAQAEDAAELVEIDWRELPPAIDERTALEPSSPVIHPSLGNNLCYERTVDSGDVDAAFSSAVNVVEADLSTARHTHVTLEPRSLLAHYNKGDGTLTVWHSTQVPHMMHAMLTSHFGLPETAVRVIAPDVGGSFGLKIHVYGDEMATVALSMMLGRPVKFVADRMESFLSDFHARGHHIKGRMAVSQAGEILALEVDDIQSLGPYASYPRGGVNEAKQIINLAGAAYRNRNYRARTRVVFQNKSMYGQYRSVGHPIACLITEVLAERAARSIGVDPAEFRGRNYIPADGYPWKLTTGPVLENLSQHQALDKLLALMRYDELRAEQAQLREHGVLRGIGLASFLEMSNPSSATYGQGGVRIASQDACTLRLMPGGTVFCTASVTEIGQGAATVVAQIAATCLGLSLQQVRVKLGDTDVAPYGGDNWGSRGTGIGGEAVLQTARALRSNIVQFAAAVLGCDPEALDLRDGAVCERRAGVSRITLEELATIAYFRTDRIPTGMTPELMVTRSYAQRTYDGICTNGIQASHLEVDPDTGFVRLLGHWVVEDSGRIINPLLLDEQVRGGVVQGIGAALYEQCMYSAEGQLINGNLMDYHVPLASDMPDIVVAHTETATATSELGAKGAGEAGVAGASAAVVNAVNDALSPLGASVSAIPITPRRLLQALGKVRQQD